MTENQNQKSVYFVSLGCPKNLVDSQVMLGLLERDRYTITQNVSDAHVIIVNTCSFIEAAKTESIETILEMASYKDRGKCQMLVASGCMVQRYADELQREIPEIDLFIGTGQYHRITEALDNFKDLPKRVYIDQPAFIHSEKDPRMLTGPKHSAYLKLSEGCNRRCSFCIIPKMRGFVRSRTVESLVEEAKNLSAQGVRELNLVAQDLTHYGIDTRYKENLKDLLKELVQIEGIEWIRLHYVYPDQLSEDVMDLVGSEQKIVKYLDMPIQHTNDRLLKLMHRPLTKKRLFEVIQGLRARVPEIVFRTSIIVGFPGETEEEFQELKRDLLELDLDHVGVFTYSKEEGTAAAKLTGAIHPATRRRRQKELNDALAQRVLEKQQRKVGLRVPLLVEGPSEESEYFFQARLATQAQEVDGHVMINDVADFGELRAGEFVEAEITEAFPTMLLARVTQKLNAPHEMGRPN